MKVDPRNIEINRTIIEALGMRQKLTDGLYWDYEQGRTRMLLGSELHKNRVRLFKQDEDLSHGFVFDVFQREEDLRRAEQFVGIAPPNARVDAVLEALAQKARPQ
jgi:hypothetical protein